MRSEWMRAVRQHAAAEVSAERDRLAQHTHCRHHDKVCSAIAAANETLGAEVVRLRTVLAGLLDVLQQPMQAASHAHLAVQVAGGHHHRVLEGRAHVLDDLHRRVDVAYLAGREALTSTADEAAPDA